MEVQFYIYFCNLLLVLLAENDSSFTAPGASDSQEVLHSLDNVNGEEGSLCANATHEEESNTAQLPSTSDKRRSKARDHEV